MGLTTRHGTGRDVLQGAGGGALFALVCLVALLITACGEAAVEVPATTATATAAAQSSPPAAESRTIETAYGPVTFPSNPARVVAFGDMSLDISVALGVVPVGSAASRGISDVAPYMQGRVGDITIIGTLAEPNLESIVELDPDVILGDPTVQEDLFTSFNKIAPTFVPKVGAGEDRFDWATLSHAYAEVLGRPDAVAPMLQDVEAREQAVAEKVSTHAGESATVLRWMPQGPVVMSGKLVTGQMLKRVGLTLPAFAMGIAGGHSDVLSLENLAEVDTDWLFVATMNADADAALTAAREQPAFQRLQANQSGQVVAVNGQLWSSANGPLAAMAILDDIERGLAK